MSEASGSTSTVPFTRVKNEPELMRTSDLPESSAKAHGMRSKTEPFHISRRPLASESTPVAKSAPHVRVPVRPPSINAVTEAPMAPEIPLRSIERSQSSGPTSPRADWRSVDPHLTGGLGTKRNLPITPLPAARNSRVPGSAPGTHHGQP